jgi:dual specificity protein kinase YAK1
MIFSGLRSLAISKNHTWHGLANNLTDPRNRYLILDVLGQGTFGQVVKCQNLKTGEVVAVKVVKNRTAYFNQSMMEVSVLDLVGRM